MTAAALAATYAAAFPHARPWSADEIQGFVDNPHCDVLGDAQCFMILQRVGPEAEVITLATHPDCRRQGRARALMEQAFALDITRMFLEVAADNHAALALYKCLGFVQIGHRPQYYTSQSGVSIDAYVMEWNKPAVISQNLT